MRNLYVFAATAAALISMSSASAAELVRLDTANTALVKSLVADQSNLQEVQRGTDIAGNVHIRYAQEYKGIPVYGYQVIKHERLGKAAADLPIYTGDYVNGLAADVADTKASMNSEQALATAKQMYLDEHTGLKTQKLQYGKQQSNIVYYIDKNQTAHLAYYVNFFVDLENGGAPARPYYLLDAANGSVLKQWNGLTTENVGMGPGGNTKTGEYQYDGNDFPKLDVEVDSAKKTCTMSTAVVHTVNLNKGTTNMKPYSFKCYTSKADAINGGFSPANDAHYYGGLIYSMYETWYKVPPINMVLSMRVHYSTNYENAFWDGQTMSFGDGASTFYPLVSLDVAGHEVSHGFTEQHSSLEYQNQSGGINEAFSDMAGKSVEFFTYEANSWAVGEQIFKDAGALRYMDQPSRDGESIDSADQYYDGIDPHFASGVFNRAFYLLANSPGYTTQHAFDLMESANAHYWTAKATYVSAAQGVLMAAHDLGYDTAAVITAFAEVGVKIS